MAVAILDTAAGRWADGGKLPQDKHGGVGFAALAHEGRLFASGTAGERLERRGTAWTPIVKLGQPRYFHRLVSGGKGKLPALVRGELGRQEDHPRSDQSSRADSAPLPEQRLAGGIELLLALLEPVLQFDVVAAAVALVNVQLVGAVNRNGLLHVIEQLLEVHDVAVVLVIAVEAVGAADTSIFFTELVETHLFPGLWDFPSLVLADELGEDLPIQTCRREGIRTLGVRSESSGELCPVKRDQASFEQRGKLRANAGDDLYTTEWLESGFEALIVHLQMSDLAQPGIATVGAIKDPASFSMVNGMHQRLLSIGISWAHGK